MTTDAYKLFSSRGDFTFYLYSANLAKFNSSIKEVKFKKYTILEDKSVVYNYDAKVETIYTETKEKKDENISGQITITKSNDDKWILTNINKMREFTNEERFLKLRS